jgi:2-polyprenyl-6-methoxyphenol hydroxylase-like FAD-dependent oxidoreductase
MLGGEVDMRISVVGAGVAGLTAALALQRDGHDVRVVERAETLRAGGFGLNLWSNATSLLDALGVSVPGEPFDHIVLRAGGRSRATMSMPTAGRPHVNAERGALLRALEERLKPGTVRYGVSVADVAELHGEGADLVVAADGLGSRLRPDASRPTRDRKPWVVWQAMIPAGGDLIDRGGGAIVVGSLRFVGIWRHPQGELCWFIEEPNLPLGITAAEVVERVRDDEDPLVARVARLTPPDRLGQWLAHDRWPTRQIIGERLAVIGDAAHPMQPCIGQGACTAIEDGVELAASLRGRSIPAGLAHYRRRRLTRVRARVATAHLACTLRRPSPIATAIAATPVGVPFAVGAAAWMRQLNRTDRRLTRGISDGMNP